MSAALPEARYAITHETRYGYRAPVVLSHQMLHLAPRPLPWQRVHAQAIAIEPAPHWRRDGVDAFGNPVCWMGHDGVHGALTVHATLDVTVGAPPQAAALPWELVRERLRATGRPRTPPQLDACRYAQPSPHVPLDAAIGAYAQPAFTPGRPLLDAVAALMARIHAEFTFDARATTITTPVAQLLTLRRGVCQDYAHFMIAALRALGLAARYVSGYLLTHPPPGRPRLVGADASHAWVAVWCPSADDDAAWVAFDPTNGVRPGTEHITLAWGRDFSDVSPLRGVILGGGSHVPEVAVTVTPLENR